MLIIICILLGIGAEIVNANAWFVIPNYVSWICYGLAGVILLFRTIIYFIARKQMNNMSKEFNNHFRF